MASEERDLEMERRMTRIETKQDMILDRLEHLPIQHKVQVELDKLNERLNKHDDFRENVNQKIAWVAGAFGVIFTAVTYGAKYVYNFFAQH